MQIVPLMPELASRLERLFPGDLPVPTRLWAILDGVIQGRILVDEPSQPTYAFIVDVTEGHVYLGGALTPPVLQQAFTILRAYQGLVVCLWPDDPFISMLPVGHEYEGVAIDFSDRSPAIDIDQLAHIPPGYELRNIDAAYAHMAPGFDYYAKMFGSIPQATQNMVGCYLVQGETIACEAVAAPLTRGVAELGVNTTQTYRHKGLATALCATVIRQCEALGYRVFWNAAQQNLASVALARRLGFRQEQPMTVLAWSAIQANNEIIPER
jgi:L-amino acid N-acyltransferase YncA